MDSASAEAATLGDVGEERDDTRSSSALKLSLSVYRTELAEVAGDCQRCVHEACGRCNECWMKQAGHQDDVRAAGAIGTMGGF